jgi:RNA polymerase-binding protein DksA
MDVERARRRLLEERERLRALIADEERVIQDAVEGQQRELSHDDPHSGDIATEVVEEEIELALRNGLEHELKEVEAALERIEQGTYGRCEACGRPIPDERLEAVPAARYCLEDQARLERRLGADGAGNRGRRPTDTWGSDAT